MSRTVHLREGLAAAAAAMAIFVGSAAPAIAQAPAAAPTCQGPPSKIWIDIAVSGVRNSDGLVAVTLYSDDQSRFLAHHGSLYTGRFPAHQGTTQTCIYVPRAGVYAIATYHDENGNQKLDRGITGLPTEAFGFSNNPSTFLGIPAFSSVRLNIPKPNLGTTITLRYP